MSRMETVALTNLIDRAEAGCFTLPDELTHAWDTYLQVKALPLDPPTVPDLDTTAARLVAAVATREPVDLLETGRGLATGELDRRAEEAAGQVHARATEQAANTATRIAADLTERIITDHLRPAVEELHAQARKAAAALDGYGLDTHRLLAAPAAARNAYTALTGLVERRKLLFTARRWANTVGQRQPQHDVDGYFGEFATPLALHPGWTPPARLPQLPAPPDPAARLLWVVSDQAAPATPWFPTVAEQDAAWWEHFGEGVQMRARAARDAEAIAARIDHQPAGR